MTENIMLQMLQKVKISLYGSELSKLPKVLLVYVTIIFIIVFVLTSICHVCIMNCHIYYLLDNINYLYECVSFEIAISIRLFSFISLYRVPNQSCDEIENFISNLDLTNSRSINVKNPFS